MSGPQYVHGSSLREAERLSDQIRRALEAEDVDIERVDGLLEEAAMIKVPLDQETLEFAVRKRAEQAAMNFGLASGDLNRLEQLESVVNLASSMPFPVNLWEVQNLYAQNMNGIYSATRTQAEQGDEAARTWVERFNALANKLRLRV